MAAPFSVALIVEARDHHEQLVQILSKSVREFKVFTNVDDLIKLAGGRPINVLLFGLNTIEQNEAAYFRLLKTDPTAEQNILSSILLCSKNDVKAAFQLCRKGLFNDYFVVNPLYDPYHLLLRFRALKETGSKSVPLSAANGQSLNAVCESLDQIAQLDGQVSGINLDMLQHLGQKISVAMDQLSQVIETQIKAGVISEGDAADLISQHSPELVHKPITSHVSDAVSKVKKVSQEAAETALDQRVALSNEVEGISPRNKKVIVIEDNAQAMADLVKVLEDNACAVEPFSYGVDFSKEVAHLQADIVMLDLTLPDITSFHLINLIRQAPGLSASKLFVMAQTGDSEKLQVAMDMGVDEVVMKPIDAQMMAFKLSHY